MVGNKMKKSFSNMKEKKLPKHISCRWAEYTKQKNLQEHGREEE